MAMTFTDCPICSNTLTSDNEGDNIKQWCDGQGLYHFWYTKSGDQNIVSFILPGDTNQNSVTYYENSVVKDDIETFINNIFP